MADRDASFLAAVLGDGRPLAALLGLCLALAGGFAIFQSLTGLFLPHDALFLGQSAAELCAVAGCRVVAFMFHDRVAFGGALVAAGTLYVWLAVFPLARGERWALRTFAASGLGGFLSFLAFLGNGYLDTWHAVATALLVPVFVAALLLLNRTARAASPARAEWRRRTRRGFGALLLLATAAGILMGGAAVLAVGASVVFVPQDIAFIGLDPHALHGVSPRLVPLIAHDRAGFGGALLATGIAMVGVLWCAPLSRSLWQALVVTGVAGFGAAIGVHAAVGYHDLVHVGPAVAAAIAYTAGLALTYPGRAPRA
jgi:hypothetical protein